MSKKTWTTVLIVLLVVAAAVAVYFLTRPQAAPVAPEVTATPVVEAAPTDAPAEVTAEPAAEAVEGVVETAQETVAEVAETAQETVTEVAETAEQAVEGAAETAEEVAETVTETATDAAAAAQETVEEAAATAQETAGEVVDAAAAVLAPTEGAKAKVTIWHTFTEGQEAYLKKAVEDFNAQSATAEVELLSQPYADFLKNVNASVIEGIGPDIIFNYASEAAQYVKGGMLTDLSQYIYDPEIGIEGFDAALTKGVLEGEVLGFEDGLIHYLPAYTTGPILFYNKTLFDELQIAVPTTWDEMEAAARKIHAEKGIAGLGTDSLTDTLQMLIKETEGADYIDVANKQVLFDTPEVRAKVQWLVDLAKEGVFAVKSTGDYFSVDFNSGIIGSYIGSSAGFPYITPNGFEFGMAPMPAATWYPSWNRGPIVFYYKDDARAQAAYEFVKYFIAPEVNAGWAQAVTALAPYAWTQDNEAYKAYTGADSLANQALAGVQAHLDKAGSLPAVTGANTVRNAIRDAIIKAAGGEMTADEAWTEAVTLSNAALKGE